MVAQLETNVVKSEEGRVIKFGDTIYLEHMSGDYLTTSKQGRIKRHHFPRLGSSDKDNREKVKFEILGNSEGSELTDGCIIKLKSTESNLGNRNILGAWDDCYDCYYYNDNYNPKKQGWKINKKAGNGDNKIRYGDEVYLTNLYYKNQRLSLCTRFNGYVTTLPFANEWWTLKAEGTQDKIGFSSEAAYLRQAFEPNVRGYSAANMAYLAYCAEAVYSNPKNSKAKFERLGFSINEFEHFIDFPDTNTQCIAVGDDEKIVITFRGTENLNDWKTNFKLLKAAWKVGMVHAGFYGSLQSVWPDAMNRLEKLRTNNQPIWLTGHSLGGALAALACATFCKELPDYEIAGIYTFGQPRIGDLIFCKAFDTEAKARYFRVVNNNDAVPRIPTLKYGHAGNLLYFDARGNLHHNPNMSLWNPIFWWYRLQGYYKSLFNLDSDDIGDHRMGDYRMLAMRQPTYIKYLQM
ncbi:MAG: lipase family protein [Scytonematopsis contorta HA4267-MV1]|jgi:triacylglycerol lipase|nr:lipase family protein [Scytonematopsis contorta HA4267-MV1]